MVHIIAGLKGSGKTKRLIDSIHSALLNESGSMVCIEKGNTMRFDVDHRVRLIDASEYAPGSFTFLKGFVSGLHAGNFDISHIFVDNLYKISHSEDEEELEAFLHWCENFSQTHGVDFTLVIPVDPERAPDYIRKHI